MIINPPEFESNLDELSRKIKIENLIHYLLHLIGENPRREGLQGTPERVARMYQEVFRGYDEKQKPEITVFQNNHDGIAYDQMIIDKGYFFSHCEHHIVPFFGTYAFAYIPNKKIIGLSKVARLVDYFSARLQVQERLTRQIADELEAVLKPQGIALVLSARHLCKEMRGVKKQNGEMVTSEMRGAFRKPEARQEFFNLIGI